MVGKLERVPLREVWPHEANDFSRWLQDNIDILGDSIDLNLGSVEREKIVGSFSVDIVAEDEEGGSVIIENQLGKTDHDHLGKLLTYMVTLDASTAVWISSDPRPEHISVVNWLNESSSGSFYLLKLEAVRIGESDKAPLLTLIVGPTPETRGAGSYKRELTEHHQTILEFWKQLLEKAREKTGLHSGTSPTKENWLSHSAGISGIGLNYVITKKSWRAELYINRSDAAENRRIFDILSGNKDQIEEAFGSSLIWDNKVGRQSTKIYFDSDARGYEDRERWSSTQDQMIDTMIRLESAVRPHLDQIKISAAA